MDAPPAHVIPLNFKVALFEVPDGTLINEYIAVPEFVSVTVERKGVSSRLRTEAINHLSRTTLRRSRGEKPVPKLTHVLHAVRIGLQGFDQPDYPNTERGGKARGRCANRECRTRDKHLHQ